MNYPNLDTAKLTNIETLYYIKCLDNLPFPPDSLVQWECNLKSHQWTASAIEVQIDQGCFQCDPKDIKVRGNGTFSQNMSVTLSKVVNDFEAGAFQMHQYSWDSGIHIILASFFFNAVRTEFVLKELSKNTLGLRLSSPKKFCFWGGKPYSTVELVERMYKLASSNIPQFTIAGMAHQSAESKYKDLKKSLVDYVVARNKIAHGYSKYPTTKKGRYNLSIGNLLKEICRNGLSDVYKKSSSFIDVSETLLDTSPEGIKMGNRVLHSLF
ncbi:MAG: hypothetical protein R3B45_00090 [Bdellovibrionota bacterium]